MFESSALDLVLAAARAIKVEVPPGDPLWATAVVAVLAALLGAAVGGYASFRASEALEIRRRRARSQIRRKAKIYTPIRQELLALREAWQTGSHMGTWLIVRDEPPPVIHRPASLHLWKDLVEDGRAMTAVSHKVKGLLDQVDVCADALNREVLAARETFAERGVAILATLGQEPRVQNWVETDTGALLRGHFEDLNIIYSVPDDLRGRFIALWESDPAVADRTAGVHEVDVALRTALDAAIAELGDAMQRIAEKYENESPRD
jgi:hypothetical protein